jgi:RNA polymerase sigma factor (sigma-70 family)
MKERPDKQLTIDKLLHGLSSVDAGPAWTEFVNRYSALIMKVVSQFEYGQDRSTECFLYVCEKLSDRQFRRLQKYNITGKATFRNWLATVVFNLCIDWHRAEFGRVRLLPAIAVLPAFDRLVYRHCYENDMGKDACYQTIKTDFPELTMDQVTASLDRIHSLLSPRQRWQLSMRNLRRGSSMGSAWSAVEQIQEPGADPESLARTEEETASLQTALSRLPVDQRLLLHLRFQEGLTFKRIAQIERLGDTHRARRHVQAALDALFVILKKVNVKPKRQN